MSGQTPTHVLREEHQRILRVLSVLENILIRCEQGESPDFDGIEKCAVFFKLFADACHHGKEEDLLFPELESRGIPREGGPIGVMLYEHQQGRALVKQIRENLDSARKGDGASTARVTQAAGDFIVLLRNHIAKEDNILFMMADRVVDPSACQSLCSRYEQVCARQFEGRTKAQLENLASELADRYGA